MTKAFEITDGDNGVIVSADDEYAVEDTSIADRDWELAQHEFDIQFKRNGLVAFLDVLGYSAMARSDSEDGIRRVMTTVASATDIVREKLIAMDRTASGDGVLLTSDFENVKGSVISDSIIIHTRFTECSSLDAEGQAFQRKFELLNFIRFCRCMFTELMNGGLPIRGALAIGDYFGMRTQCSRVSR